MDEHRLRLIDGFLEDGLSEKELDEFLALIRDDAAFRDEAAHAMRLHGLIRSSHHPDPDSHELARLVLAVTRSAKEAGSFETRVMRRLSARRKGPSLWPIAAAAAAVAFV